MNNLSFHYILILLTLKSFAQEGVYVATGIGPAIAANQSILSSSNGALKGSYGEGFRYEGKTGYMFTDKFGIELSVDYLDGKPQNVFSNTSTVRAQGQSKVYGLQFSTVVNIYKGLYVRAGLATKIHGENKFKGGISKQVSKAIFGVFKEDIKDMSISKIGIKPNTIRTDIPIAMAGMTAPIYFKKIRGEFKVKGLPDVLEPSQGKDGVIFLEDDAFQGFSAAKGTEETHLLELELERKNNGEMPFGFIAAMGFKHPITNNLSLFAEVSFLGLNAKGKKSVLTDFKATYNGKEYTRGNILRVIDRMNSILDDKMPGKAKNSLHITELKNITGNILLRGKTTIDLIAKGKDVDRRLDPKNQRDLAKINRLKAFKKLKPLINDETSFVDEPDSQNPNNLKTSISPYSSVNFSFGLTYSFSKRTVKKRIF